MFGKLPSEIADMSHEEYLFNCRAVRANQDDDSWRTSVRNRSGPVYAVH